MSVHTLPNSAQCASAAEADFRDFETLNNWPEHDDATCDAAAERLEKSPRYYFAEAGREWIAMREVELARDKVTEIPAPPIAGEPAGGVFARPFPQLAQNTRSVSRHARRLRRRRGAARPRACSLDQPLPQKLGVDD